MKPKTYPVIDLHTDYVLACYEKGDKYGSAKQTNRQMLKRNGVRAILAGFSYDDLLKDTDLQLSVLLKETSAHNGLMLVKSKKDLENALSSPGKTGVVIHLEGAGVLDGNMDRLHELYEKGVRSIGLTHSVKNSLASGNRENPKDPLTPFGREVVKEAVKKGMALDLAHLNEAGFWEVMDMTKGPVLVSHACAYTYCPDPRNLTDDQIKAVARRGGVIGVFFSSKYVTNDGTPATVDDVVRHFVHIAEVGGVETVALGTDYGGITTGVPRGLESVDALPGLFERLGKAGFSEQDLALVSHGNAQRVLLHMIR
jgi:membrane dipeptidase